METTSAVGLNTLVERTTKSAVIAKPVLDTFTDLTIYISVICGILGAILIFAVIGWILDQFGVFGDPIGRQMAKRRKKKSAGRVHSNYYPGAIPRANEETTSRDFPAWVYRAENQPPDATGENNDAFDNLDHLNESMKAQQKAAKHLERICSDLEEELSDSDNETDDNTDDTREHDISPSAIAAYEKNRARGGHGFSQGLRMSGRLSQEMLNQLTSQRTFQQITPSAHESDEPTPSNPYEPSTTQSRGKKA